MGLILNFQEVKSSSKRVKKSIMLQKSFFLIIFTTTKKNSKVLGEGVLNQRIKKIFMIYIG